MLFYTHETKIACVWTVLVLNKDCITETVPPHFRTPLVEIVDANKRCLLANSATRLEAKRLAGVACLRDGNWRLVLSWDRARSSGWPLPALWNGVESVDEPVGLGLQLLRHDEDVTNCSPFPTEQCTPGVSRCACIRGSSSRYGLLHKVLLVRRGLK